MATHLMTVLSKPQLLQLPVEKLRRGKYQPRRDFDPVALKELADSIRSSGIIQPIVVRQSGEYYEIIAGERRWRGAQLAALDSIPCLVNDYSDEQAAAVTAIENIQRQSLNPIEEANSFQRLIDEFGYLHEEVAAVMGKSRTQVTNSLRLLRLDERVKNCLINGQISEGHGKILAGLDSHAQLELAERCIRHHWSVRQLEQQIKKNPSPPKQSWQADTKRLERILSEKLSTPVKLDTVPGKQGGWLRIQFHDLDTLNGLLEKIGYDDEE